MGIQLDPFVAGKLVDAGEVEVAGGLDVLACVVEKLRAEPAQLDVLFGVGHAECIAGGFEGMSPVGEREGERAQVNEPAAPLPRVLVIASAAPFEQCSAWVD